MQKTAMWLQSQAKWLGLWVRRKAASVHTSVIFVNENENENEKDQQFVHENEN